MTLLRLAGITDDLQNSFGEILNNCMNNTILFCLKLSLLDRFLILFASYDSLLELEPTLNCNRTAARVGRRKQKLRNKNEVMFLLSQTVVISGIEVME